MVYRCIWMYIYGFVQVVRIQDALPTCAGVLSARAGPTQRPPGGGGSGRAARTPESSDSEPRLGVPRHRYYETKTPSYPGRLGAPDRERGGASRRRPEPLMLSGCGLGAPTHWVDGVCTIDINGDYRRSHGPTLVRLELGRMAGADASPNRDTGPGRVGGARGSRSCANSQR